MQHDTDDDDDDAWGDDRAALLRLLDRIAAGGWQDEHGREVAPEVARDVAERLRGAWVRT